MLWAVAQNWLLRNRLLHTICWSVMSHSARYSFVICATAKWFWTKSWTSFASDTNQILCFSNSYVCIHVYVAIHPYEHGLVSKRTWPSFHMSVACICVLNWVVHDGPGCRIWLCVLSHSEELSIPRMVWEASVRPCEAGLSDFWNSKFFTLSKFYCVGWHL
jgi:hypothetical protein